jgi:hypothetical protein
MGALLLPPSDRIVKKMALAPVDSAGIGHVDVPSKKYDAVGFSIRGKLSIFLL